MLQHAPPFLSVISERDLRRQIDRSVARALVDSEYAAHLLSDPTVVLEGHGCPPQHYLSLRSIQACSVRDFAHQVQALFWACPPSTPRQLKNARPFPFAAGAVSRTG